MSDTDNNNGKKKQKITDEEYQRFTNPADTGVYRSHPIPPNPPIPETPASDNRHPTVKFEKPERYGFYIPPSIGKTNIVRNIPRPVYVDALLTPNPPSFKKEAIPTEGEVRGFIATQSYSGEGPQKSVHSDTPMYSTPTSQLRSIRKSVTSNGKTGSPESFTVDLASNIRNIRKIRLLSLVLSYVVPATFPLVGYVFLREFPNEGAESYFETGDAGTKYTGMFPLITGTLGATKNMAYAWPYCCYELPLYKSDHTVESLIVDVLKEDPVGGTTGPPGTIIPFTEMTQFILEVEFFVDDTAF